MPALSITPRRGRQSARAWLVSVAKLGSESGWPSPGWGGKRVAGGKREARGPRLGGVRHEPWQGRKAFIRMLYLSPLQGSRWLHPLTRGCAALARGYSLAAASGQSRTRFATETRPVAKLRFPTVLVVRVFPDDFHSDRWYAAPIQETLTTFN